MGIWITLLHAVVRSYGTPQVPGMMVPYGPYPYNQRHSLPAFSSSTNMAEKRAYHNATERARRENLNNRFQELAHSLPSLADVRKPSKSVIVNHCLTYVAETKKKLEHKDRNISSLKARNAALIEEVNQLRMTLGMPPTPTTVDTDDDDASVKREGEQAPSSATDTQEMSSPSPDGAPISEQGDDKNDNFIIGAAVAAEQQSIVSHVMNSQQRHGRDGSGSSPSRVNDGGLRVNASMQNETLDYPSISEDLWGTSVSPTSPSPHTPQTPGYDVHWTHASTHAPNHAHTHQHTHHDSGLHIHHPFTLPRRAYSFDASYMMGNPVRYDMTQQMTQGM
ncbi:hypothetical protein BC832DRAFT_310947 [Gaertneriomyces semiglobifer]|nr:hypothetical protein BC832DRAFT_310947 [Gaertneriomyces semiglobifer]